MKKLFFLMVLGILGFAMLSGISWATTDTYEDLGIGFDSDTFELSAGPPKYYSSNDNAMFYIHVKYPGAANFKSDVERSAYESYTWYYNLEALNGTSWVSCAQETVVGRMMFNTSCWSNQGIYREYLSCGGCGSAGLVSFIHYIETSTVEYVGSADYSETTYMAGSSYDVPKINRYYPNYNNYVRDGTLVGISSSRNASGFYWDVLRDRCAAPGGVDKVRVINYDSSNSDGYEYSFYANFTALDELELTSFYPDNSSNVVLEEGETGYFSISVNYPAAVQYFAVYVDGNLTQYTEHNSTFFLNSSKYRTGVHTVEIQAEDNYCSQYPTALWTVSIGRTVSLSGYVYNSVSPIVGLSGASVYALYYPAGGGVIMLTSSTDSSGHYNFSNLWAGEWALYAYKTGYVSESENITLFYRSSQANTDISWDFYLDKVVLTGTLDLSIYDALTSASLTGYELVMDYEGVDEAVVVSADGSYTKRFDSLNVSVNANRVIISGIPMSWPVYYSVSKSGYNSSLGGPIYFSDSSSSYRGAVYLVPANTNTQNITALTGWIRSPIPSQDYTYVSARYTSRGIDISGATCSYSCSGLVPATGAIPPNSLGGYSVSVFVNGSAGTYPWTITCSKSGADVMTISGNLEVESSTNISTRLEWVSYPDTVVRGSIFHAEVNLMTGDYRDISGASCVLTYGGPDGGDFTMLSGNFPGHYKYDLTTSVNGTYEYYVSCSKEGYKPVVSDLRYVRVIDYSPTTTLPSPPSCSDGRRNGLETDVDCGGAECPRCSNLRGCKLDSDCRSNYCSGGLCMVPSCSDGKKNGIETGIDCGGDCPNSCVCFGSWDCDSNGLETCVNGSCIRTNCSTTCDTVLWWNPTIGFINYARTCCLGGCYFVPPAYLNCNASSPVYLGTLSSLSKFSYVDGSRTIWVSSCEDGNYGARLITEQPTEKVYYFAGSDYYGDSPTVPDSGNILFGKSVSLMEKDTSMLIPELCDIPYGSENITALLSVKYRANDGISHDRSLWMLNFRESFRINATYDFSGSSSADVRLNRPGTCYYRNDSRRPWTASLEVSDTYMTFPINRGVVYYVMCNTSWGESATAQVGTSDMGSIFAMLIGFGWGIFMGVVGVLFSATFGKEFVWNPIYFIPLVLFIFLVVPSVLTLVLTLIWKNKARGPGGKG